MDKRLELVVTELIRRYCRSTTFAGEEDYVVWRWRLALSLSLTLTHLWIEDGAYQRRHTVMIWRSWSIISKRYAGMYRHQKRSDTQKTPRR